MRSHPFRRKIYQNHVALRIVSKSDFCSTSEYQIDNGNADIYLKNSPLMQRISYEWAFELKNVKDGEQFSFSETKKEALKRLKRYTQSATFSSCADMKYAVLLFVGKKKYEILTLDDESYIF